MCEGIEGSLMKDRQTSQMRKGLGMGRDHRRMVKEGCGMVGQTVGALGHWREGWKLGFVAVCIRIRGQYSYT